MEEKILIADDELDIRESLSYVLEQEGYKCKAVSNGNEALEELENESYDILISDIIMPGLSGVKLLEKCSQISPQTMVVLMTAYASVETVVEALRHGAADYFLKPLEFDEVILKIEQMLNRKQLIIENKILRRQVDQKFNFNNIIGQSEPMQNVLKLVERISKSTTNILITGATGTGKELIARSIHKNSDRNDKPFIPVNCGAIPENLYESEFFGYKKGAFTGANTDHEGLFQSANKGTLFLDEVGDLPENVQVKLLRAIQEREIKPLGFNKTINVDVRIISATNKELQEEVNQGRFREDLYYRLNVVELNLPSLSERKEDIPILVEHFINKYNHELKKNVKGADNEVIKILMGYEWKGNLRELENMIERSVLLSDGDFITVNDLPAYLKKDHTGNNYPDDLTDALEAYEKQHISNVLHKTDNNRSETAKLLGIDPSTLYRKMVRYSIKDN